MFGQAFNSGFFKAPCFTDTTDIFKDNSGVALYTLDYDASDSGGATGKFNEGAVLTGTSSQINFSSIPLSAFNATTVSVSLWVNMQALTSGFSSGSYVFRGRGNWIIQVTTNGVIFAKYNSSLGNNGNNQLAYNFSGGTNLNQWYHIVVTDNGTATSGLKLYVDGVLRNSNSGYANIDDNSWIAGIANYAGRAGGNFKVDQLRIFNKVISASEVTTLYNETKNTTNTLQILGDTSCIATYPFDGSSTDLSGNYNGTDTNIIYKYDGTPTAIDFGVGGKSLYGARFNGTNSYIYASNSVQQPTTNFSVSVWSKWNSKPSGSVGLVGNFKTGISPQVGFAIAKENNENVFSFHADGTANSKGGKVLGTTNFVTGEWYHTVGTYDGSNVKIYVNGTLEGTVAYTATPGTTDQPLVIGRWYGNYSGYYHNGQIDQVRIFNKAISAAEVSKLYGNGAGEIACKHTATTTNNNYPVTNVAYYKLDNSAIDETGSYTGTESNIEYRFGRYGQAAVFNGSSSKIVLPNSSLGITDASNFSFSCWFKTNSSSQDNQALIWTNGSNAGARFGLGINSTSQGGDTSVYFGIGTSSFTYINSGTGAFIANTWVHVVGVKSSTTGMSLYVDNVLKATNTGATGAASTTATGDNRLGGYKTTAESSWFNGSIDQVRMFSSALDSDQVTKLYNEKPEPDTSNFKTVLYEGTGATQYISNIGMDLETHGGLLWIKNRDSAYNHVLYDHVRNSFLYSNLTNSEDTNTTISFEKSGFITSSTASAQNANNNDYVGWVFKGGGDAVLNTQGSINTNVSANVDAGFSIINYTGNSTAGATIGHGLSAKPEMIFIKSLDNVVSWIAYDTNINSVGYLDLRDAFATSRLSWGFNSTAPTNSLITLGNNQAVNSSSDMIAYCWHSVSGYSKVGSYTGNGSTDNKITLDFAPNFVMLKNTSLNNTGWLIHDTARDPVNTSFRTLLANANTAEYTSTSYWLMDFESDGFRLKYGADNEFNKLGDTFTFMAFK